MTKTYNKLVRDKIAQAIQANGQTANSRTLSNQEYIECLRAKLQEEVAEYLSDDNVEELADILEVIHAIAKIRGLDFDDIEALRKKKAIERGGFEQKLFLIDVSEP